MDQLHQISEKLEEITKQLNGHELVQERVSTKLETLTKALEDIKNTLRTELLDPKVGVIAMVAAHEKHIRQMEEAKVLETVRDSQRMLNNLTKLSWILVSATVGILFKLFFGA